MASYEMQLIVAPDIPQNHSYEIPQNHSYETPSNRSNEIPQDGSALPFYSSLRVYEEIDGGSHIRDNPTTINVSHGRFIPPVYNALRVYEDSDRFSRTRNNQQPTIQKTGYFKRLARCGIVFVFMILFFGATFGLEYLFRHSGVFQEELEVEPTATLFPTFYKVDRGHSVTIYCSASSNLAVTSVSWQKMDGLIMSSTTNPNKYRGSTVTTPSLTIVNAEPDDAGNYTCLATNSVGTGSSNVGTLVVKEIEPRLTISPTFYLVLRGNTVTIKCSVSSYLPVTSVSWQKMNGQTSSIILTTNTNKYRGNSIASPSLTIVNADCNDIGQYTCFATNSVGTGSSNAGTLVVTEATPPTIQLSPNILSIAKGQSVTLECNVSSDFVLTSVSWHRKNVAWQRINGTTSTITSATNRDKYRGSTVMAPSLTIVSSEPQDTGEYTCFATNSVGTGSSNPGLLIVIDVNTMDFKFKRSSLYKDWYINEDNTFMSNVKTTDTIPSQGFGFNNYHGVMADKCCAEDQEMTFGILYNYDIGLRLEYSTRIFEIGLSEPDKIDNFYYVGPYKVGGWSFNLNTMNIDGISLNAEHIFLKILSHVSSNIPGTTTTGVLQFSINRKNNTFSVVSNHTKLYTFFNVVSQKDLCPVFGVYNPGYVNVNLRLIYSTVLT